jgi:mannose-6-phosphate isomerase-like protein (cupin superfamily)
MKAIPLFLALISVAIAAETPIALHPDELKLIEVSPGVILKELTGRSAPAVARSDKCSVALFHLEPGRASAWSYNKVGEESFFVLKGHGEVWTNGKSHTVGPGSYILVPPSAVRSIRASKGEVLEFYAVTAPAWSQDDDVLTTAPAGAPK